MAENSGENGDFLAEMQELLDQATAVHRQDDELLDAIGSARSTEDPDDPEANYAALAQELGISGDAEERYRRLKAELLESVTKRVELTRQMALKAVTGYVAAARDAQAILEASEAAPLAEQKSQALLKLEDAEAKAATTAVDITRSLEGTFDVSRLIQESAQDDTEESPK